MIVRSVQHRGLLRLIEDDDGRELRADMLKRLRNILAVLMTAAEMGAARPAGASTNSKATAQERGASRSAAIGG